MKGLTMKDMRKEPNVYCFTIGGSVNIRAHNKREAYRIMNKCLNDNQNHEGMFVHVEDCEPWASGKWWHDKMKWSKEGICLEEIE